jgi:hypothetical protein
LDNLSTPFSIALLQVSETLFFFQPRFLILRSFYLTMSTKVFALLFVFCLALSSAWAALDSADQVIQYDAIASFTGFSGNVTSWPNTAASAAGNGDLVVEVGSPVAQTCGSVVGIQLDGSASFTGAFSSPLDISSTDTVVVIAVATNDVSQSGRQGVLSTSSEVASSWSEGSVGPGIFATGTEYYQDASDADISSNVLGTSGLALGARVAVAFIYTPDAADTTGDINVINGVSVAFFAGPGAASLDTTGAFATIDVGHRASGGDANQFFTGCIQHISVYVSAQPVDVADVAETMATLVSNYFTSGSTPGNATNIPSPSPQSRTTGRKSTTSKSTTTTGRKGTTTTGRRKSSTTGVSAASLPVVAPAIQVFFAALVSAFLFFMW